MRAAVIVGAVSSDPRPLAEVLASHTAIHAAEGALYRRAVAESFSAAGVAVTTVARRELDTTSPDVTELGRGLGPPWRKEHKEAALAAVLITRQRRR